MDMALAIGITLPLPGARLHAHAATSAARSLAFSVARLTDWEC